jgi:hypothetical protein
MGGKRAWCGLFLAARSAPRRDAASRWRVCSIIVGVTNVRYRIVTNGGRGRVILDGIDMLIRHVRVRGWHLDGIYENRATRPELQGQPLVRELNGPGWWEEGDCVMYEEREL